ncbi:MAG: cytochrome b5 domain-containing protein [Tessaracoccus sp.]|uniref:cytochrome b5 domain-containing protein n=1 Tax=Tessaracoccus sp. TaxID=1971211 RepID=UPI001ED55E42|nr:cytochrome b5-like heme/steroid binding domain-containing protein [Tessaracoccus sp.]MBK7822485.1 cytochrome b5 domain-containing protein [Tessaracoccus sp.]
MGRSRSHANRGTGHRPGDARAVGHPGTDRFPGRADGVDPRGATGYTMDDVAAHNTEASCWAAIDGNVYDLTEWIGQHPGGSHRILPLCGTDATAAFTAQHAGQARPASELASFLLGPLAE